MAYGSVRILSSHPHPPPPGISKEGFAAPPTSFDDETEYRFGAGRGAFLQAFEIIEPLGKSLKRDEPRPIGSHVYLILATGLEKDTGNIFDGNPVGVAMEEATAMTASAEWRRNAKSLRSSAPTCEVIKVTVKGI